MRSWGFLSPAKTILVPTEKFLVKKERREEVSIEREDRNNRKRKRIKNGFSLQRNTSLTRDVLLRVEEVVVEGGLLPLVWFSKLRERERGGREGESKQKGKKQKKLEREREREEKTRNLSKPTHHLTAFSLFALE